jgi:hypothetical protein
LLERQPFPRQIGFVADPSLPGAIRPQGVAIRNVTLDTGACLLSRLRGSEAGIGDIALSPQPQTSKILPVPQPHIFARPEPLRRFRARRDLRS